MKIKLAENADGKFYVYEGDYIGDRLLRGERWEPWVMAPILDKSDDSKVFIDVGAFIGTHTVVAARKYKHVHAFEPYPEFAGLLRRNVELNGLKNVTVHEVAISDDDGNANLHDFKNIEDQEPVNLAGVSHVLRDHSGIRVAKNRLDTFGFKNVRMIKIDVQGLEYKALQGARNTIKTNKPVVLVEGSQRLLVDYGDSFTDIRDYFHRMNYNRLERLRKNCMDFMGVPKS